MGTPPGRLQLISSQTLGAHAHETILIPLKAPNESAHDEIARRRLVALLDTIACADHISRGHVVKRALVREVEQHIRRALRTLGCLRRSLLIGQLHPYNRGGHEESHPPVHLSHEPDRWDGVRYLRV